MRLEGSRECINPQKKAIVDRPLVFQCLDLVSPLVPLLVDLVLLGPDEGSLVDVWVDLDVRVIAQLEVVLRRDRSGSR